MTLYDFERKLFNLLALKLGNENVPFFNEAKLKDAYSVYRFCTAMASGSDADSRNNRTDDELASRGTAVCLVSRDNMWIDLVIMMRVQTLAFPLYDKTPRVLNIIGTLCCCDKVTLSHNKTKGGGDLLFTIGEFCINLTSGEAFYCMDADYDESQQGIEPWADRVAKEIRYASVLEGDMAIYDTEGDGVRYIFDKAENEGFPIEKLCNGAPEFVAHSRGEDYDVSEIGFDGDCVEMPAAGVLAMLKAGCLTLTFMADPETEGCAEIKFSARNQW